MPVTGILMRTTTPRKVFSVETPQPGRAPAELPKPRSSGTSIYELGSLVGSMRSELSNHALDAC